MQGIIISKTKIVIGFFRKYAGQIAYYACVALVLTAVAVAAERFRNGDPVEERLVLPAVELTEPASHQELLLEKPAGMSILRQYADKPEWNDKLCHWETHAATDYRCADGNVRSLSEGIVKTVGKSGAYGGFIEVESDGFLIRYASVMPLEGLEPGDKIEKGEMLGVVDDSMPAEAHMGAHLHLELIRDGDYLDFEQESSRKSPVSD